MTMTMTAQIAAIAVITGLIFLYSAQQAYALDLFSGLFGKSAEQRKQEIYQIMTQHYTEGEKLNPDIPTVVNRLYDMEQLQGKELSEYTIAWQGSIIIQELSK